MFELVEYGFWYGLLYEVVGVFGEILVVDFGGGNVFCCIDVDEFLLWEYL